jgi:hypothetical protein
MNKIFKLKSNKLGQKVLLFVDSVLSNAVLFKHRVLIVGKHPVLDKTAFKLKSSIKTKCWTKIATLFVFLLLLIFPATSFALECGYAGIISGSAPIRLCAESVCGQTGIDICGTVLNTQSGVPSAQTVRDLVQQTSLNTAQQFFETTDLAKIEAMIRGAGSNLPNISQAINSAPITEFSNLLSTAGINPTQVGQTILQSDGNFGRVLRDAGSQILSEAFKKFGGSAPSALGGLMDEAGFDLGTVLSNVDLNLLKNTALISGGGDVLGTVLGATGATDFLAVFNGLSGSAPSLLGNVIKLTNNPLDVATVFNAGGDFTSFLSGAGVGRMGQVSQAINQFGGGTFGQTLDILGGGNVASALVSGGPTVLNEIIGNAFGSSANVGDCSFQGGTGASGTATVSLSNIAAGALSGGVEGALGSLGSLGGIAGDFLGGGLGGLIGGGGSYVPVKDSDAIDHLNSILGNAERIVTNTEAVAQNTAKIQANTAATREFLRQMCVKEIIDDPEAQKKWAGVAGHLVDRIVKWVGSAYGQNPIFVTNPYVYYRNVDMGVATAFIEDVKKAASIGSISNDDATLIIRAIQSGLRDNAFPDAVQTWDGSPDEEIFEDPERFNWRSWMAGTLGGINTPNDVLTLAEQELTFRRTQALEYEREKLAWGRGFFPYELCGQNVFSGNPSDIRTCKTLTPGAVIQDVTSIVLTSALRQIENADEKDEWISRAAFSALNTVFYSGGLEGVVGSPLQGRYGIGKGYGDENAINNDALSSDAAINELKDVIRDNKMIKGNQIQNETGARAKQLEYFKEQLPPSPF